MEDTTKTIPGISFNDLEQKIVEILTQEKNYSKNQMAKDVVFPNQGYFDMIIKDKDRIIASLDINMVATEDKINAVLKSHVKNTMYTDKPNNWKIFFIIYIVISKKIVYFDIDTIDTKKIDIKTKPFEEFPLYEELILSTHIQIKQSEIIDTNKNYKLFKKFSWILGGVSFVLFLISLFECTTNTVKLINSRACNLIISYPKLILFGIAIILILMPFLKKIKTNWFEIDWDYENGIK